MIFENKKTLIAGIQQSGKTYLAKQIARSYKCLVHTPHKLEWKNEKVIIYTGQFLSDFELVCKMAKHSAIAKKIQLFIIDEIDMIFSNHFDLKPAFTDLVNNHAHYNLGIIGITKRVQDVPARYYGTFENLLLFKIESPQTRSLLDKYAEGLGTLVFNLDYNAHQFVSKELGGIPEVCSI